MGEILRDFMDEFNLFSANNSFMKPKGQLWILSIHLGNVHSWTVFSFAKSGEIVSKTQDHTHRLTLLGLTIVSYQHLLS